MIESPTFAAGRPRVVVVSGLSGAGKGSILRTLEDIGFETVDNPPLAMIDELVERTVIDRQSGLAVCVDARTSGFDPDAVVATVERLRHDPRIRAELVFAWAEDGVLLRRFTETRRRHPLAARGSVQDGIATEQTLTGMLREAADMVVDTSDMPLVDLRRYIETHFAEAESRDSQAFVPTLISFAFPAGLPREADMVFDVRFLRNPHYIAGLRELTGLDAAVGTFVESDPDYPVFLRRLSGLVDFLLPRFVGEGKKYMTIAVGCTGGRHRSVYLVERLAEHLVATGWQVSVMHRELARQGLVSQLSTRGACPTAHIRAREA